MRKHFDVAALALVWVCGTGAAQAAETVLGGGYARACHDAAVHAADSQKVEAEELATCDLAIKVESLSRRDLAASLVNRGILYLCQRLYKPAEQDFDSAIELKPDLAGAYTNRGAALIGSGHPEAGIADIDRGLALGSPEPEKAYFNRGLAHEQLGDLKAAYIDYMKAVQLKPDWPSPLRELARFTVSART
jgi:tetratricopeptide (TPR) repeat protein